MLKVSWSTSKGLRTTAKSLLRLPIFKTQPQPNMALPFLFFPESKPNPTGAVLPLTAELRLGSPGEGPLSWLEPSWFLPPRIGGIAGFITSADGQGAFQLWFAELRNLQVQGLS